MCVVSIKSRSIVIQGINDQATYFAGERSRRVDDERRIVLVMAMSDGPTETDGSTRTVICTTFKRLTSIAFEKREHGLNVLGPNRDGERRNAH